MIHRFVDLLEELEPAYNIIWNIRRVTGGTDRTFAVAGGTPPVPPLAHYLGVPTSSVAAPSIDRPNLSPDLTEYCYELIGASGTRTQLRSAAVDDLSPSVLLASNPSGGAANPFAINISGWSPDGQHVYYMGVNDPTLRDTEWRRVDRDGTNNTLLHSSTVIDGVSWGTASRISPDGDLWAWWVDASAPTAQGVWVMNSDGTSPTRIYTMVSGGEFYGWSRDSNWLLYRDSSSGANWDRVYKIHPDGTGQTILYETTRFGTDRPALTFGQDSVWLPDESGILCRVDTGSGSEVGVLLADGSETFTPFSPSRISTNGPVFSHGRAWWTDPTGGTGGAVAVVSSLLDGSDYRVDDDLGDSSTVPQHDDFVFNGFFKRAA